MNASPKLANFCSKRSCRGCHVELVDLFTLGRSAVLLPRGRQRFSGPPPGHAAVHVSQGHHFTHITHKAAARLNDLRSAWVYPALMLALLQSLRAALASPQPDVQELLQQVATTCRRLYLRGYIIDVKRHLVSQSHFNRGPGADTRSGLPFPIIPLPNSGNLQQITLARLGEKFQYQNHNTLGETWDWLTDGHTLWCYRPDLNQYTEAPAPAWPVPLGPATGIPGAEWHYFTKFLALATMKGRARIVNDDPTSTNECPGASVIVELNLGKGPDLGKSPEDSVPGIEHLRILTVSHLPCQSTIHRVRGTVLTDTTETIVWKFHAHAPDPSQFAFPLAKAKKVKYFPVPPF